MKRTILIFAGVVAALLATVAIVREPGQWPAPELPPPQGEAADLATGRHSTAAIARLIREPQNTWSNLALLFGGALIVATAATRSGRHAGIALVAVGAGSFLYHASASEALRQLDVGAMYWLFFLTAVLCATALRPAWRPPLEAHGRTLLLGTLLLAVVVTAARNVEISGLKPLSLRFVTALAAAMIIVSLARIAWRLETIGAALQLLGIVTLFGIAAACQTFDRPGGRLYAPGALVQAHAVWHVLAAATFGWAARALDHAAAASRKM